MDLLALWNTHLNPTSVMATTIEELSGMLTRGEIKHAFDKDGDIYFGFQTENYTNPAGTKTLGMHLSISNEGQMFSLTAHHAFKVKGSKNVDTFLKLCSIIQMSGYLIQFEYLPTVGTVRPCIEIPLIDNKLTKSQLDFCIASMVKAMEDYFAPLQKAIETGSLEGLPEEMLKVMKEESSDDTSAL